MEWCRMSTLGTWVSLGMMVLLGCNGLGLTTAVPDARYAALSGRHHKLTALLKSLDEKSPTEQIKHTRQNISSSHNPSAHHPSVRGQFNEGRARSITVEKPTDPLSSTSDSIKSYQDFYRVFYGTPDGVNHLRRNYGPTGLQEARSKFKKVTKDLEEVRKANDHFLRIHKRARCRNPTPQVIRVKDYYPDPSREYLPRCTLLHRCSDTTGCCESDALHCVPSAMQEVPLRFYTLTVGRNGHNHISDDKIETLLFDNHTACHCQPVNDLPRLQTHPLDGSATPNKSKCLDCPVPFTSRIYQDGRCGCDCFDRQRPCLRVKRGKEPLSKVERRCVGAKHCRIPDCEFGPYDERTGYCPRNPSSSKLRHQRHPARQRSMPKERN